MALTSYPFDDQPTTETQYSNLFRELQDSGVVPAPATAFQVTGDGSAMTLSVQPGFAIVRGHAVQSTAVELVPISASTTSLRIDRVVLRLDPVANSIVLAVVPGTPGGGVPDLTQTDSGVYELPLARVNVAANATTLANTAITDDRPYVGTRVRAWSDNSRPASPRAFQLGYNTSTNKWEYHNGTAWADLLSVVTTQVVGLQPTLDGIDNAGYLGSKYADFDKVSGNNKDAVESLNVTIPAGLSAKRRIKVTAGVFVSTGSGIGSAVWIEGTSNSALTMTRKIDQGATYDAHLVGIDTNMTPGPRAYVLSVQCITDGQLAYFRQPYIFVEII